MAELVDLDEHALEPDRAGVGLQHRQQRSPVLDSLGAVLGTRRDQPIQSSLPVGAEPLEYGAAQAFVIGPQRRANEPFQALGRRRLEVLATTPAIGGFAELLRALLVR